jgi:hypothetical protein
VPQHEDAAEERVVPMITATRRVAYVNRQLETRDEDANEFRCARSRHQIKSNQSYASEFLTEAAYMQKSCIHGRL